VILVVTRIGSDGSVRRRMLDTAGRADAGRWEGLVGRAPATVPPYRSILGSTVYHLRVDDYVVVVGEQELSGPLRDLVTAILAEGGESRARPGDEPAAPDRPAGAAGQGRQGHRAGGGG
jgi:hypothetical protein